MVSVPKLIEKFGIDGERLDWNMTMSVLLGFIFSLLCVNHLRAVARVLSMRVIRKSEFSGVSESKNCISSAYMTILVPGRCWVKSFVKSKNSTFVRIHGSSPE